MNLDEAVGTLQKTRQFLHDFKNSVLKNSITAATELAGELEMTPKEIKFPQRADVRRQKKTQVFPMDELILVAYYLLFYNQHMLLLYFLYHSPDSAH